MLFVLPTADEICGFSKALLSEDGRDEPASARRLRRMQIIWSALTILHETDLCDVEGGKNEDDMLHDNKVVGFYAILMTYWFETNRVSEIKTTFINIPCLEESWEVAKAANGTLRPGARLSILVRLYLDVGRALGSSNYAGIKPKTLEKIRKYRECVGFEFPEKKLNILSITDALLRTVELAKSAGGASRSQAVAPEIDQWFIHNVLDVLFDGAMEPRRWDKATPGAIHPLWTAATFYLEGTFTTEERVVGFIVMLLHDFLEEIGTLVTLREFVKRLPRAIEKNVYRGVVGMTFQGGFSHEKYELAERPDVWLFKAYDKLSNLLDGAPWMVREKDPGYIDEYCNWARTIAEWCKRRHARKTPLFVVELIAELTKKCRGMDQRKCQGQEP